jgi:hypothetical protein
MSEISQGVESELVDVEKVDNRPQIADIHAGGDTCKAQSLDCEEGGSMIGWLKRRVRNWLYRTIRSAIADEMAAQFEFDAGTTDRHIVRRAIAETAEFLRASGMRLEQSQPNRVALMKACFGHIMPTGLIVSTPDNPASQVAIKVIGAAKEHATEKSGRAATLSGT